MSKRAAVKNLPYFLGVHSLKDIASKEDRVAVLNILGSESRTVTPISHAFSGGNIVFGTAPGKGGQAVKTPIGDIPVYDNIRDGLAAGHKFNTGVVYLPPSGVRDGVSELIRVNPELEKIIIITEKVSVHDAREIRALGQSKGIDIFGANCLGVADSWSQVRLGGALGGHSPEETLKKGSIALFSNSGSFTTTIAQYLSTEGWGTTTLVSSGKDIYIHYSVKDFNYALSNDDRSKAAVLYVEPGGYYEHNMQFDKPVVACVVGRWKSKLTRAVGHAGAMAGSGDKAENKEQWLMDALDVKELFTPDNPVVSKKGAVVVNIADIPKALTAVMALNNTKPDFKSTGSLSLKPWIANDQDIKLPPELALPVVEAPEPYASQIASLHQQVGAVIARQNMKDKSGASMMDPSTMVTSVYNNPVLNLALEPLAANFALPLTHEVVDANGRDLLDIAVEAGVNLANDPILVASEAAREAGNAPNTVMAAAASIVGPNRVEKSLKCAEALIDLFVNSGLKDGQDEDFDFSDIKASDEVCALFTAEDGADNANASSILKAMQARKCKSAFLKFLLSLDICLSRDAIFASIAVTLGWGPMVRKRVTRLTVETLPWYLSLYGVMIGASIPAKFHQEDGSIGEISRADRMTGWSMGDLCFFTMTGRMPSKEELSPLQTLIALLISNGPGTISAQGAKGAVAADGPQTPSRVQINKAMVGFLSHTGYSHGGNGFEGMAFLIEQFKDRKLKDPTDPNHGIDLKAITLEVAKNYKAEKKQAKELGTEVRAIPGIHHPVFKGKPVNYDPRERFIAKVMEEREEYNIFHQFYLEFVQALYDIGASRYVFCVNVDAVIAAQLLAVLWKDFVSGALSENDLEKAAFQVFLFGRMIGAAAEIDDHLNRGRNMDTRTPLSQCSFVL